MKDPERYGVVGLDGDGQVLSIEEKPGKPKSSWVITDHWKVADRNQATFSDRSMINAEYV